MTLRADSIDCLGMLTSVTARLKSNDIHTIGDLLDMTRIEIFMLPGVGRKSRNLIFDVLKERGLWFSENGDLHDQLFSGKDISKQLGLPPTKLNNSVIALRDYFAAKAMQAIIMSVDDKDDISAPITESAYKWADSMMKARNGD